MTPNLHCGKWCTILFPPSGSFVTTIKDVSTKQNVACCCIYPILGGKLAWHWYMWCKLSRFTWYVIHIQCINLVLFCLILRVWHCPRWSEVHVCAYLFSYLLITGTFGYQERKEATYFVQPSFIVQYKWIFHEISLVLCVK